jgi:hypothetical protein
LNAFAHRGAPRGKACAVSLRQGIEFNDRPSVSNSNLSRKRSSSSIAASNSCRSWQSRVQGGCAQPETFQPRDEGFLGRRQRLACFANAVEDDLQGRRATMRESSNLRETCGSVARICKRFLTCSDQLFADSFESGDRQVDFASHFKNVRRAVDAQRQRADGLQIIGDIIPAFSVAPRRPTRRNPPS